MSVPDVPPDLEPIAFAALAGWAEDDHGAALAAFRRSAQHMLETDRGFAGAPRLTGARADWLHAARASLLPAAAAAPREFFEHAFAAFRIHDPVRPEGLFTGYYEADAQGSLEPHPDFPVPIYRRPPDLVKLAPAEEATHGFRYGCRSVEGCQPFASRAEIEAGSLAGRGLELVWLSSWVDAYFIHIQGSGRVRLSDGRLMRLAFAAKNGRPYYGIGAKLIARGLIREADMSMQALRAWMAENTDAARALMAENQSYIFFREVTVDDPALGPPAAAGVNLTSLRSLAVDRAQFAFGSPLFLETRIIARAADSETALNRLMIAQDTGSAIRGVLRGDIFFGHGPDAAWAAGHQKHPGRLALLLPRPGAP